MGGGLLVECSKIEGLRNRGDIPGAREAATKCLEGLEQALAGMGDLIDKFPVAKIRATLAPK